MPVCIVYDKATNQPINRIVANVTDTPPEGCYLVEELEDTTILAEDTNGN